MSEITITAEDLAQPESVTSGDELEDNNFLDRLGQGIFSLNGRDDTRDLPRWRRLIAQNDRGPGTDPAAEFSGATLNKLWEALPDEITGDRAIANNIDMRSVVMKVLDSWEDKSQPATINGVEFSTDELLGLRTESASITVALQSQLDEDLRTIYAQRPDESTEEYDQRIKLQATEMSRSFLDGDIAPLPERLSPEDYYIDPETGELVAGGDAPAIAAAATDRYDESFLDEGTATELRFMTGEEIQELMQESAAPLDGFDAVRQSENSLLAEQEAGAEVGGIQARVHYDDVEAIPPTSMPGFGADMSSINDRLGGKETYTLSEVLRMPAAMGTNEVLKVTQQMEAAGIFELSGGKPRLEGDSTDPRFKAAWRHLVAMSMEKGQSMTSLLKDRASAYEEAMQEQVTTRLSDPARISMSADSLGRELLGRKLTEVEHARMTEFVHNLERENAMTAAGLNPDTDIPGVEQLDEGIMNDIEAQMAQYVRSENPLEAESNDVADQFDGFTRMLAGPGRGVT